MRQVEEVSRLDARYFEAAIRPLFQPVVMRGLASDWEIVRRGKTEREAALRLVAEMDSGIPTDIMIAPASENGRFFFSSDMRSFNFSRQKASLSQLVERLREFADKPESLAMYAGATDVLRHLPGFLSRHPLPLVEDMQAVARIWIGNATQVATHFDLSDNLAVVALGKRRFTLFPPDATPDLYVGPLNITLAGQPVSMVDPLAPDREKFPRFENAEEKALVADLDPGDAIYIPTLWWHHVVAEAPHNILVNYWHNDALHGGGFLALVHAMLAIREQNDAQREAWRVWFDHFVFGAEASHAADHLPAHAQGVNGPASPARDDQMRKFILQVLSSS